VALEIISVGTQAYEISRWILGGTQAYEVNFRGKVVALEMDFSGY